MPDIIFHGGFLQPHVRSSAREVVDHATDVLVVGTSLPVWSSASLVRRALQANKNVVVINHGTTRVDDLLPEEAKIDADVGSLLRLALEEEGIALPPSE